MYGQVVQDIERPPRSLIDRAGALPSATLSDAMGRSSAMSHRIRAMHEGASLVGAAVTVLCPPGDNLMIHKAFQYCTPGDVLVVDTTGSYDHGLFGHNMALYAHRLGVKGIIIDGSVRDSAALRAMPFPTFAVGSAPRAGVKRSAGSVNIPISCGGLVVSPGDLVVGDDDGVAVVPRALAEEIIEAAEGRASMEAEQAENVAAVEQIPLEILYGATWVDDRLEGQVRHVEAGR